MKYLLLQLFRKFQYLYNCYNFDSEYYLKKYIDIPNCGMTALEHYRKHGWFEGRYSSLADEVASTLNQKEYMRDNPDVIKSKIDPVLHCLRHGIPEGRVIPSKFYNPYLDQNLFYPTISFATEPEKWEINLQTSCLIAVQCHVFYVDLLPELQEKLNNIPYVFDLYITTDSQDKADIIYKTLKLSTKVHDIQIQIFPNKGRDVVPFLLQMQPVFARYDYICHLHTKKSFQNNVGNIWRRACYDALLGSESQIRWIFSEFQARPGLGIFFPHITGRIPLVLDWGAEKVQAAFLWQKMSFTGDLPKNIIFPAGNMFWVRTQAVRQLFELTLTEKDIPQEQGQLQGTVMHAIERLWCYVARENGYAFGQISLNAVQQDINVSNN